MRNSRYNILPILCTSLFIFLCIFITALTCEAQVSSGVDAKNETAWLKYLEAHNLFREAQRQRSPRLMNDAINAFKETIELDPKSAEPHADLGEIYFLFLSQRENAETEAKEAIKIDPNNFGARLLLARICAYRIKIENESSAKALNNAIVAYEKVVQLDPGFTEGWSLLSEYYELIGEEQKQINALQRWAVNPIPIDSYFYRWLMQGDPAPDQAWFRLSRLYLSKGETGKAIEAARYAYELDPESNAYVRNLIGMLRSLGKDEELRVYSLLMKQAATPAIHLGYGSALVRAGKYNDAIAGLKNYIEMDISNAGAIGILALAQRRANRRSDAIDTLRTGLANVETHSRPDLIIMLGETYEESGRDEEALAEYDKVFKYVSGGGGWTPGEKKFKSVNAPMLSEVLTRILRVCRRTGNASKLQTVLEESERLVGNQSSIPALISIDILREDGKKSEALKYIQQALKRMPDDRSLKLTEAVILNELNKYDESIASLRKLVKGDKEEATDDSYVYLMLSSSYLQKGDVINAENSIRKAIELNPDDQNITIHLSSVLNSMKRFEESEKILRSIIDQNPDNASALNNLGYYLLQRESKLSYEEALKYIERAVTIEPLNGSFLDSLGWAQFKLGKLSPARDSLKKAMIYSRSNSTVYEHLGDVHHALGETVEARRHYEKALELSPASDEISRIKSKLDQR